MKSNESRNMPTIMVVDDDKTIVHVLTQKLREQGYTVLPATDGDTALDLARRHPGSIDLLLTDVVMPKMGGPQLAELLLVNRPETRILFMSGLVNAAAIPMTLRYRSTFVQKQHPLDGLFETLQKLLPVSPQESRT